MGTECVRDHPQVPPVPVHGHVGCYHRCRRWSLRHKGMATADENGNLHRSSSDLVKRYLVGYFALPRP